MISSILEIVIGWFVTYKAPRLLGAKGVQAKVVMLIGILLMVAGVISFMRSFVSILA